MRLERSLWSKKKPCKEIVRNRAKKKLSIVSIFNAYAHRIPFCYTFAILLYTGRHFAILYVGKLL